MHLYYFFMLMASISRYFLLDASLLEEPVKVHRTADVPMSQYWEHWKFFYDKVYTSSRQETEKLATWIRNLDQVYNHNALYERRLSTYNQKLNEFGDMTYSDFNLTMLGSLSQPAKPFVQAIGLERMPKNIDWSEKGAVTSVKHQRECRCGWAFAAAGAHEGNLFLEKGILTNLSVQQLVDCTPGGGCWYGSTIVALTYIGQHGLTTESQYPYVGYKSPCVMDSKTTVTDNNGFDFLLGKTEHQLKSVLYHTGPVAVNIHVTKNFVFYNSGIFFDTACAQNELTNHAVLLVGYGNDPEGGNYWLIKNSWGTQWGMGGYAKMARNTFYNCGIAKSANVPMLRRKRF